MTHTSTEQPEALMRLADNYAEACFDQGLNQRTTDDKPETEREKLEKAIRRMHTRIAELEAQLAAIGAGGVEPLRPATEVPQVQADARDAARYRWLRACDLETIGQGGVFAGMTPQNVILNGQDLDDAVDAALAAQTKQGERP